MEKSLLNIVFIGPLSFPLGFASTKRRRYIIDYLNSQNIQAHVLCTKYAKNSIFNNEKEGHYGNTDYYDLSDYLNIKELKLYYIEGKKKLKEWYDPSKKNILIFHTVLNFQDTSFFIYAKKLGYKIIFDQVETSYKKNGKQSFKRNIKITLDELVTKYAYKRCNGSFVISKALEKQNKDNYPQMPICILPNSSPVLQQKQKEIFSDIPKVLYSGTYTPKDGVEDLIRAFLKVQNKGIRCKLVLTGKGNYKDMRILDLIKNNPYVEYKGMVSDDELVSIINECDILTMTRTNSVFSNYGFPFKLSEYLSTGNPVIATKVSDVASILTHKENAYLVNPESSDEIADGIIFYIQNPDKAIEIGLKGLQTMKNVFSIEQIGKTFVEFMYKI